MMRRNWVVVAAAAAAVLLSAGPLAIPGLAGAATGPVRAASSWGRAIEVPGLAALNKGRDASVGPVSCPSPGSCTVGGSYTDSGRHQQGFVVSERNRRWGQAIEVPGLAALNKRRDAAVTSVSCASAGNCVAGGFYGHNSTDPYVVTSGQGFVVSERNGRWGQAAGVPGLANLSKGGNAGVGSVSCAAPGNCAAGGFYTDGSGLYQGFVVSERSGRWGQATEVPGLGALNKGGLRFAGVSSVSCAAPGSCVAGGNYYTDAAGHRQAFVVSEKNGRWGTARQVAGNLNAGGSAFADTVSCGSAGNCSAGGAYRDGQGNQQAFVVSEVNGTWAAAREVAGRLNTNGTASVASVSCASAGNCSAGGDFDYSYNWGYLVGEKNGAWGHSIDVPGLKMLRNVFRYTDVNSVSCASAGNCAAGGDYETMSGSQGFVVSQKSGTWGHALTVPGLRALNKGNSAEVTSVSCAAAGSCTAVGTYWDTGHHDQGFVTQDSTGTR
jgi:hypothetical protein